MRYISTRGKAKTLTFAEVVMTGVASDGGLYVPENLPKLSLEQIKKLKDLSYVDLAFEIIKLFIDDSISHSELHELIKKSYKNFSDPDIAPLREINPGQYMLELFHGPTLSFKDFALQFLGNLFDYYLKKSHKKITIIGATSGDTGSAAIEGCYKSKNIELFILYPYERISEVQRRQMTTIIADNVNVLAVKGNFDDCQNIVKELFQRDGNKYVAVNSINWCRIMAQIVYYFHAVLKLDALEKEVVFSVPTGNFGDIYAGFVAKQMGLPIKKLVIATNANDILHRFLTNNDYSKETLKHTLSPSMDIQVSSNFERLLFNLHNNDGKLIADLMANFAKTGSLKIAPDKLVEAQEVFASGAADDKLICETIADIYKDTGLTIDPHTATGFAALNNLKFKVNCQIILSTAHPAKFPEALTKAKIPAAPLPNFLKNLHSRPESEIIVDADIEKILLIIS